MLWVYFVLMVLSSYSCHRIAKRVKMSKFLAVLAGLILPIIAPIIYSHHAHYLRDKEEEKNDGKNDGGVSPEF